MPLRDLTGQRFGALGWAALTGALLAWLGAARSAAEAHDRAWEEDQQRRREEELMRRLEEEMNDDR